MDTGVEWVRGALGHFHVEMRKLFPNLLPQCEAPCYMYKISRFKISNRRFTLIATKGNKAPDHKCRWTAVCCAKLCWRETLVCLSPLGHTAMNTHRFITASLHVDVLAAYMNVFKLSTSYLRMMWQTLYFLLLEVCPRVPVECMFWKFCANVCVLAADVYHFLASFL